MRQSKDSNSAVPLRLFLLVENRLLREALAGIIHKNSGFSIMGVERYTPSLQKQVLKTRCDVLVADHASANTFPPKLISDLVSEHPQVKVVFFGMEDDPEVFLQAVRAGVSGYLLGDASADETLAAIHRVAIGEAVCPAHLCMHLFQFVAREAQKGSLVLNQRTCAKLGLTRRQQQLLSFLARGLTNKEIAASLNLSEFTVKNHVHRIMRQLKAENRYAAVQTACESTLGIQLTS